MSKLLISEQPLQLLPNLAVAIGLNEAIVLQQIHYWINNKSNKGYEQDGYKWVYNTYAEWKETNFPFWSENTIQRIFASLEEKGLVVSIQPMKGKYDRTKYYRIEYTKLDAFEDTNLVCSLNESENTAENTTKSSFQPKGIEQKIWAGLPVEQSDIDITGNEAFLAFQTALSTPSNWSWYPAKTSDEPAWAALREFVIKTYQADPHAFRKYAEWRGEKYARGAMSNLAIRRAPAEFEISFSDFLASSSMYGKKEEQYTRML